MAETDGLDKSGPTTQAAAQELHDILESLPAFEPCYGPVENWHDELRRKRFPVWDLWPEELRRNPPVKFKDTWWAYGRGWLVMCDSECRVTRQYRATEGADKQPPSDAVQRLFAARAREVPDTVHVTLANQWRLAAGVGNGDAAEPEVFVRNDWHERRSLVRGEMPRILRLLDFAIRAVRQAKGNEAPLVAVKKDDLLHDATRDRAIGELREIPHIVTNAKPLPEWQREPTKSSTHGAEVARVLDLAHRHSLTFLMHACFSLGCYRDLAHRLAVDRNRTGKVERIDVQNLQGRWEQCMEATADLKDVYESAWSLLVDAHRPQQGSSFAFQCVYDMARAADANWRRIRSSVPGEEVLDLIISTGKYTLCSEERARTYWNDINAEFAVARRKHGLLPQLFRHPQADELAAMDAMIGDLLKPTALLDATDTAPQVQPAVRPSLGSGGPAKTLDSICRAIMTSKVEGQQLAEGDSTSFHEALKHLGQQDEKKAKDYMAPSGRLCAGGWITRVEGDVVLTAIGALEGNRRRRKSGR